MEKLSNSLVIGDWRWKRILGKGSFGEVSLWENCKTLQQIATKKCILIETNMPQEFIDKFKERWNNELEMLTIQIKNENIVQTMNVNPDFIEKLNKTSILGLPILVLEYCNGGDLRKELCLPENYCGLKQPDVLNILKALKNAISYLHGLNITHRDIKPENIVIKKKGHEKIYKITDLGYAKNIEMTVEASYVGTAGYFAPEVLLEKEYSNTVDYWSMGIIIFEVVCGCRPFLPHLILAQNFRPILEKKSNHIAITENFKGEYIYHSNIFKANRINRVLREYLETWLKSVLELDKQKRGCFEEDRISRNKPSTNLKIFTKVDEMLSLNTLTIFCLITYQFLSYEVTEDMTLNEIIQKVVKDTRIEKEFLFIIPPLEIVDEINGATKPIDLCCNNSTVLYVTKIGSKLNLDKTKNELSDTIIENMNSSQFNPKIYHVLEFCRQAIYFIEYQEILYKKFLKGLNNYAIYLNDLIIKYEKTMNTITIETNHTVGAVNFLKKVYQSRKNIMESRNITIDCADQGEKWQNDCNRIYTEVMTLNKISTNISVRYESILRRSYDILSVSKNFENQKHFNIDEIKHFYEELKLNCKKNYKEEKLNRKYQKHICCFINNCLKERTNLLKSSELKKVQEALSHINEEFLQIKLGVVEAFEGFKKCNSCMENFDIQQFNNILEINNIRMNNYDDDKNNVNVLSPVFYHSIINSECKGSLSKSFQKSSFIIGIQDTKYLIEENQKLRKKMNEFLTSNSM